METSEFNEDKQKKENRRKLLNNASKECENIQFEIKDWKAKKKLKSPGLDHQKLDTVDKFSEKIEEIRKKIQRRKSESKEDFKQKTTDSSFDLKAHLHASLLNQEIITKQYQILLEKHETEVNFLNEKIRDLSEKISKVSDQKAKEYEEKSFKLEESLKILQERTVLLEKNVFEKEKESELAKIQLQDRDKIIVLMLEKIFSLEKTVVEYKEKDFECNNHKVYLEKEKKRREIAENEYRKLIEEVKQLNERSVEQVRIENQQEIEKYKQIIYFYEKKLQQNNIFESYTIENYESPKKTEEKLRTTEENKEKIQKTLENQLEEGLKWKNKALALYSKFFPVISSIKEQLRKLRQDSVFKQNEIKKIFIKTVREISKKYNQALDESDKTLHYFKTKLESLENRKASKLKFCKPS